jgi:hemin uptake protein HemP
MPDDRIESVAASHSVFLLIEGQWVCLERGLSLDQAKAEGVRTYKRCRVTTEIRERNGTVIKRWEPAPGTLPSIRIVKSADLMQGASEILIEHRQTIYRLRATTGGKLILNR